MDKSVHVVGGKEYYGKVALPSEVIAAGMSALGLDFESRVLLNVVATLGPVPASFTNGTLFVECSVPDAVRLETQLLNTMKCGIILSRVGNESSFDFV